MAWLSAFKLGRPGYEVSFDVNPDSVDIDEGQIASSMRVLSGARYKRVFCTVVPEIRIATDYFPKTQRDLIASLLSVTDTGLSFLCRDDWTMKLEQNSPTDSTHVALQNNSITRLSTALVAAGVAGQITVTGVFDNPAGTGTNYFTSGSYADATRVVTLGSALPTSDPCYCTYTYKGWLVHMDRTKYGITGGRVDLFRYDIALVGG